MQNLFEEVFSKLSLSLQKTENENKIDFYNYAINEIEKYSDLLKKELLIYQFESEFEEINYFKNCKPLILAEHVFFKKMLYFEMHLPLGSQDEKISFYQKELNKLSGFFYDNNSFVKYIRANQTDFDRYYFIRANAKKHQLHFSLTCEIDYQTSTGFDYKLAIIKAQQRLEGILNERIDAIKNPNNKILEFHSQYDSQVGKKKMKWTSSQSDLVELIYGLYFNKAFNNGNTDIKEIATFFEDNFNIKLNNFYRTFTDIKNRKSEDKFSFISAMIKNLETYSNDEFNPN